MQTRKSQALCFLMFDRLARRPGLRHGVSLRRQGTPIAGGQPTEFNLSGQDPQRAQRHCHWFCQALQLPTDRLVRAQQVHASTVAVVREAPTTFPQTDALCTSLPDAGMILLGADCPLIVVYDPQVPALGVAHAGWRGCVQRIAGNLVATMVEQLGADPKQMLAGIGPGICGRCYEIGSEVVEQAEKQLSRVEDFIKPVKTDQGGPALWTFDLIEANRQQLIAAGLYPAHIESCPYCTCENNELFFSYRREGAQAGRWALLAGLKAIS